MIIEDEIPEDHHDNQYQHQSNQPPAQPNIAKRKLVVWSFNPSFTLKRLIKDEKPRCLILTSGTLVPFETYENEFDIKFPVKLVADHVIDKEK